MMQNEWWWYGIWVWVAIILFNWNKSKRQIIMWQRKCYWTLIQVCLTDDVIPAPPPNRGDPSPAAAVDQSRVLQTIERVFAELQLQRQSLSESCHYWITTGNTTSTAAQIPRAWLRPRNLIQIVEEGQMFWWLSKLSCANAYRGVDSYLSLSCLVLLIGEDLVIKGSTQMH